MMNEHPITVRVTVNATPEKAWKYWNEPEHVMQWAFALDDWECSASENDLRVGGQMKNTLGAKDKSVTFDLIGTYTEVEENKSLAYVMEDGRKVRVEFHEVDGGVEVVETFDPEQENPAEYQQEGWQAFLDNYKKHVEA